MMMKRTSSFWIPVFILMTLLGGCTSKNEKKISELNSMLEELRPAYAPDDRVEWWKVTAAEEGGAVVMKGEVTSKLAYDAIMEEMGTRFPGVKTELVLLPRDDNGALVNGLVNNSVIHLRREPSSKTELVTQSLLGTPVRILKSEGSKSLIQVPDGYIGWVNTEEVHPLDREELAAYKEADKLIFNAQYGMAFSEPDERSMPVTDLVIGDIVCKVTEVSGYTQVLYPDGRLGWVHSKELVPAREIFFKTTLGENLVKTAKRYNGIPYLWGGASSKDIDCSGLISNVYYLNGMQLPRDADMQALIGKELTTEYDSAGLEPGDLLFFGTKASEGKEEDVTHVAMYIGDGEYIHSAGYRERVGINSMDSTRENFIERYPEIFVRAVRILGEKYDGFRPLSENPFYKEIISDTQ
jgi:SH3-like domain-containing protein